MGNKYDHRLRNAIVRSGNSKLLSDLKIPASTIRDCFQKGVIEVVTTPQLELSLEELAIENERLRISLARAETRSKLVTKSVTIIGFEIQYRRLPNAEVKEQLIKAIQSAAKVIPLAECLEAIKLSAARFRAWISRQKACQLSDHSICPKITPTALLPAEIRKIKKLVLDPALRHFSIASLALYA